MGVYTVLLVLVALSFVNKTHIKPVRKKNKRIEAPNQFPYSGNSVGDNERRK